MTVRCETDDGRMEKTGDLLDSGDGELREELKCQECGATSAIYTTRDGNELLEDGAYSDRELEVDLEGSDKDVEWDGSIKHTSWSTSYDREATATVVINGSEGELIAIKTYRAMFDDDNELMEAGKISERIQYYRPDETQPFADGRSEWDVPIDVLEAPKEFIDEVKQSAEADPQVEYEQYANKL